ncbi:cell division protein ZipA C-terminal FtsZ-binding domain-containing protein [Leucothrix arctica]|uniref:Cell division protein ZipA n=1 Tax=Leucothrix arctica TaxID=1481894 RepID=A0A317CJT1_9GAMM|nr:cell division protein ZipA C-terminal FtsZ-binding domain-containing protein [Leucothrix arctica]PWQ98746.1 hypothetical protein DKT75_02755 [Leucothrix arctica]
MDIVSILITVALVILMIAFYIMGRMSQNKLPQEHDKSIPRINDDFGEVTSSIKEDVAATDGSTPVVIENDFDVLEEEITEIKQAATPRQLVLFIAAKEDSSLSGDKILEVLPKYQMVFGEMDLFHYPIENGGEPSKLFSIANGVAPWTLNPKDMAGSETPGLSIMMQLPSAIDDRDAIEILVSTTQLISKDINGILKNDSQQPFSKQDAEALMASLDD